MNKFMKKFGVTFLVAGIIMSSLSGCSTSKNTASTKATVDTKDAVKLKMYILGDKPKDADAVYGKMNAILKQKINATIDVNFISWGDQATKYPLLFSSGEDFDLIFTATGWCYYNQMATRNGFLELTPELLQKYAPQSVKNEPKLAWEQAKVNKKIYMIPNDQDEYAYSVVGIRGDLREKYHIPAITSQAGLEKYYETIAKNEKDIVPIINGGGQNLQFPLELQANGFTGVMGTYGSDPILGYKMNDTTGKVFSIIDTPEYKDYAVKMKKYADSGYWSKSSISSKETRDDGFKAGKSASMIWNIGSVANDLKIMNAAHPEWKVEIADILPGSKKFANPYTNNGMAINANSKNSERALMALDLLRYDKDLNDITFNGVKGTHWDAVGDKEFKTLGATANFPAGNVCPWGWHTSITRTDVARPKIVPETIAKWQKNDTIHNPLETFTFDDSLVKNEMAAINTVVTQYGLPLHLGIIADPAKGVEIYSQKLKAAGLDKVMKAVQEQADKFIKSKK
ncbi:ABC transporter substrate-binding protein [Clostridium estertheticum]|uniref:ABC transporter substrate-binding protein n=1 Tax=Clostridium estertheticum TaxID=238834 RepID=UPI001C7E1ACB|nr:ABC transporter substrate-binding protein [Clostridium estertheticum]MBX4268368.1 ABC transporter substrate-binding protein [Clostridium estertheticum]WLC81568.1 ABC transporter substrate-binding protein [Clostridium estertheticum]